MKFELIMGEGVRVRAGKCRVYGVTRTELFIYGIWV